MTISMFYNEKIRVMGVKQRVRQEQEGKDIILGKGREYSEVQVREEWKEG